MENQLPEGRAQAEAVGKAREVDALERQPTGSCCPREGRARDHPVRVQPSAAALPTRAGGAGPPAARAPLPLPGALAPCTNSLIAVPRHRTPLGPASLPRAVPTENSTYPANPEDKLRFKVSPSARSICCPVPAPPASRRLTPSRPVCCLVLASSSKKKRKQFTHIRVLLGDKSQICIKAYLIISLSLI